MNRYIDWEKFKKQAPLFAEKIHKIINNRKMSNAIFIERLKEEKKELDQKVLNLQIFINSDKIGIIDPWQSSLLKIQLKAMETYAEILTERLKRLLQ